MPAKTKSHAPYVVTAVVASLCTMLVFWSLPAVGRDGRPVVIGALNVSDNMTTIKTKATGADDPPLGLVAKPGQAPLKVNSRKKVENLNADKLDGRTAKFFAAAAHDHDARYLRTNAKAADSELLDGKDSTDFASAAAVARLQGQVEGRPIMAFVTSSGAAAPAGRSRINASATGRTGVGTYRVVADRAIFPDCIPQVSPSAAATTATVSRQGDGSVFVEIRSLATGELRDASFYITVVCIP